MKSKLQIIKIGGSLINDARKLDAFLYDFAQLTGCKILVHGGGNQASQLSKKLGVEPQKLDGRRITTVKDLEIVTMVYAGLINKNIVASLQHCGCFSIGLSGADANCIIADKRPVDPVDFGLVGDIKEINVNSVQLFLTNNITPVFCALTHNEQGQLLNTNADTIAAELAISMSSEYDTELIYCFEKKGVLADINNGSSIITSINLSEYQELKKAGVINEGMLPKMENCFNALKKNVSKVIIGDANVIKCTEKIYTTLTL